LSFIFFLKPQASSLKPQTSSLIRIEAKPAQYEFRLDMIPWRAEATQDRSGGQYFSSAVKHSSRAIDPVTALFNELMLLPQEGGSRQVSRKT